MATILLKKTVGFFLLLLVLVILSVALQKARGGSADVLEAGQRASASEVARLRKELQLDRSVWATMIESAISIARWDFGETIKKQSVNEKIYAAFKITFILAVVASFTALLCGLFLGLAGFLWPSLRSVVRYGAYFLLSQPVFIIAIVLLWIFSIGLGWLPPGGTGLPGWYLLPAVALGIKAATRLALFMHEFLERESEKPYVLAMRNFGYSRPRIYIGNVFRNIALPLISFWLMDVASYLAGAAIVETIFSIPGLGFTLLKALLRYDMNLVFGILCFTAILVYLISILQETLDSYFRRFERI